MKKRRIVLLCAILYCISNPITARAAEETSFDLSPEELFDATVVSASKMAEKVMDAPAAVYVLTGEDILRSGATSVPEALRLVPGVEVARVDANDWAIGIRGFNGTLDNKLLVLIDGRTVYDPLFSGVYWDIQDMVLEDIDRIEVIRGPGAALWGANAVNGVINIITKKAQDTQGNLAGAAYGNQDGIAEERYGGTFGDSGFYRAYVKYADRDDEQTLARTDAHDGQAMDHGGFRADWKSDSDARDDFTLQGDMYESDAGDYRYDYFFTSPDKLLTVEDLYAKGGNMLGRWTRAFSGDSKFTLQTYLDYTLRDQLLVGDQRATWDVDAQYELPQMDAHKIIFGGGYRYSADNLTATPTVAFDNIGEYTQIWNSFIQDKITLDPKSWFLTLGSKFEHNSYTGFEIEPDARLQWHIDDDQMAWAAVSRAVRTPSRIEEAMTLAQETGLSGEFSFNTIGSPDFVSEDLIAYELGYRRQLTPKATLDVATFYNDYRSLSTLTLTSYNLSGSAPYFEDFTYGNQTAGDTYGVETAVSWRVLDNLNLSASQSMLEMHLYDNSPAALGVQSPQGQSPKYQYNLRAQWDIRPDLSFDTMFYHVADLPDFPVDSYNRLDMRLSWKVMNGLEFNLVGQNLLDPSHREFTSPTDIHTPAAVIDRAFYGQFVWRY